MHQNCLGKVARRAAIFSDMMCEMILSGSAAQLKADRRMHENEIGVNIVMHEGSDEVDDFFASKTLPQRGTMPGGTEGSIRATASPQRGTKPGGGIGDPSDTHDPFLGLVTRPDSHIDHLTGQPPAPELCRIALSPRLRTYPFHAPCPLRPIRAALSLP